MPGSHRRFGAQDLCISAHLEARFEIDGRSSRPLRVYCQKNGDGSKQKEKVDIDVAIEVEIELQYRSSRKPLNGSECMSENPQMPTDAKES